MTVGTEAMLGPGSLPTPQGGVGLEVVLKTLNSQLVSGVSLSWAFPSLLCVGVWDWILMHLSGKHSLETAPCPSQLVLSLLLGTDSSLVHLSLCPALVLHYSVAGVRYTKLLLASELVMCTSLPGYHRSLVASASSLLSGDDGLTASQGHLWFNCSFLCVQSTVSSQRGC